MKSVSLKILLLIVFILFITLPSSCQIGIFTTNPSNLLHINANSESNPMDVEYKESVVIDGLGRVGIGTPHPAAKLHIESDEVGAFTLNDGSNKSGKVLQDMDGNGTATWVFSTARFNSFDGFSNQIVINRGVDYLYTGFSYTFADYGTYLIMICALVEYEDASIIDGTALQFKSELTSDLHQLWDDPVVGRIPGTYEVFGVSYQKSNKNKKIYNIYQITTLNEQTGKTINLLMYNNSLGAIATVATLSLGGTDNVKYGGSYVRIA